MDPITLTIAAGLALLFGGVTSAAVVGSPRAKDRAHDREQAERQRRITDLETRISEAQLQGGFREPPADTSPLENQIDELRAEKCLAHRRHYGSK